MRKNKLEMAQSARTSQEGGRRLSEHETLNRNESNRTLRRRALPSSQEQVRKEATLRFAPFPTVLWRRRALTVTFWFCIVGMPRIGI
jgi:hypothetical protein